VLDPTLVTQLRSHLRKVVRPVALVLSLDDGPKSVELHELATEVAGLSPHLTVERRDDDPRRPSLRVERVGTGVAVQFAGVPTGHELTSFVLALLQVGGHPPAIAPELVTRIEALEGTHRFETYLSLACQVCPDVVQALNTMSVLNPNIEHVAIDGALFRDEVEARQVMAVPTVYLDGEPFEQGRMTLEEVVARLDDGAAAREIERIAAADPFDVLVVGGGPAGATAAIYAARKGIRTGVVAERFGGQVLDTVAIANFASVSHTEGPRLAGALEQHVREHDVDVMTQQRAIRLVPAEAPDGLHTVELDGGATVRARSVVLSTGARWRRLGVPGEDEYRNRGVTYCPHCDGPLFAGKRVAVVGGGNSGVEAAIDLAGIVAHVTLVEFDDALRADEVLQRKLHSLPNATTIVGARTTEVLGDGRQVTGLVYEDRVTGGSHRLDLDGVFVQIGLVPNTAWLADTVERSDRGEVVVDERGRTSVPGVFAAGDCTTVPYKQIVIAMGAGSTASLSAFDHLIRTSAPDAGAPREPVPA
jgi:alkyl hydroperoxide reductase subunit F